MMKILACTAGLIVALSTSALLAANDVGSFYVTFKAQRYSQTDATTVAPTNNPYRFTSRVSQASGGSLTGGSVTPPGTGSVTTPQPYVASNDGTGAIQFEQKFTSLSALNAAFGDGQYTIAVNGGSGTYNSHLTVSGETYPSEIPKVSNTNFNNGALLIDPRKPFTVMWNSFAEATAQDAVIFVLSDANNQNVMLQIHPGSATSQLIPANTLQPISGYSLQVIFLKVDNVNTTSIPGSTGYGGYAITTKVSISTPVEGLLNISTRAEVLTGDQVVIGGIIITGFDAHKIIVRAIGPTLTQFGVAGALGDPTLELHNGSGTLIATNDNWQTTQIGGVITADQVTDIQNSGYAPPNPTECAIIATLPAGNYTAIVRGKNNTTGVALVEVYQLQN